MFAIYFFRTHIERTHIYTTVHLRVKIKSVQHTRTQKRLARLPVNAHVFVLCTVRARAVKKHTKKQYRLAILWIAHGKRDERYISSLRTHWFNTFLRWRVRNMKSGTLHKYEQIVALVILIRMVKE